jgi:hypothetical protein
MFERVAAGLLQPDLTRHFPSGHATADALVTIPAASTGIAPLSPVGHSTTRDIPTLKLARPAQTGDIVQDGSFGSTGRHRDAESERVADEFGDFWM